MEHGEWNMISFTQHADKSFIPVGRIADSMMNMDGFQTQIPHLPQQVEQADRIRPTGQSDCDGLARQVHMLFPHKRFYLVKHRVHHLLYPCTEDIKSGTDCVFSAPLGFFTE